MKVVTLGKSHSRYSLILMIKSVYNDQSIDNTITYYRSNSLKKLNDLRSTLKEIKKHDGTYLDICIFDYYNACYVKEEL